MVNRSFDVTCALQGATTVTVAFTVEAVNLSAAQALAKSIITREYRQYTLVELTVEESFS